MRDRHGLRRRRVLCMFLTFKSSSFTQVLDVCTTTGKILNAFIPTTDLPAYKFCQVMTVAVGQMVTCNRSEESSRYPHEIGLAAWEREPILHSILQAEQSSPMAEKAGLVSITQESNRSWNRLSFTALLLFQM